MAKVAPRDTTIKDTEDEKKSQPAQREWQERKRNKGTKLPTFALASSYTKKHRSEMVASDFCWVCAVRIVHRIVNAG